MARRGFSLMELLLVIVIIAILAGVVAPMVLSRSDDARVSAAKNDIESIKTAVKLFRLDNGRYPSNAEGIPALVTQAPTAKTWKEPYLEKMPMDPWGHEYHYEGQAPKSSMGYDVWSDGPDGQKETDDDIKSW
jgi:general secretion pathway protein G